MSNLDSIIGLLGDTSSDHIMVNKDMLLSLILAMGKEEARQTLDTTWGNFVPDLNDLLIDDKWFRSKVKLISKQLNTTQSGLAKKAGIDQGDLSKFEAGLKHFGTDRREKILIALKAIHAEQEAAKMARPKDDKKDN